MTPLRAIALIVGLPWLAGCLYVGPAAALLASGGGGGGGSTTSVQPTTVDAPSVERTSPTTAAVSFTVRGPAGGTALLAVETDASSGSSIVASGTTPAEFRRVTLSSAGGGAVIETVGGATFVRVPTSPGGQTFTVVWDLSRDGLSGGRTGRVRIVPVDDRGVADAGALERAGTTPAPVQLGNDAPVLTIVPPFVGAEEQSRFVFVAYTLHDSSADASALTAEFSTDAGATYRPATTPSQVTGLLGADPADPTKAFQHSFVWRSDLDPGSKTYQGAVLLRLTATDALGATSTAQIVPVNLDNNTPPAALVTPPGRALSGTATIAYALSDPEGDRAEIEVRFEREDGLTPASGTARRASGEGTTGLAAATDWSPHTFLWDYATDLGGNAAAKVHLRLEPRDASGDRGAPALTGSFVVGNDPPAVSITAVPDPATGNAPIAYTLFDSSGDLASVVVEYAEAGGQFVTATSQSQIAGLATTAPGDATQPAPQSFVWNSKADCPTVSGEVVTLRIRARDGLAGGEGAAVTRTVAVDNVVTNAAPSASVGTVARTVSGTAAIPYTLSDLNSDTLTATVVYSLDGGLSFQPATPTAWSEPLANLASAPTGVAHVMTWDYGTTLGLSARSAIVRITPYDSGPGTSGTSQSFVVGNDPPMFLPGSVIKLAGGGGNVVITFVLADTTFDDCTARFDFSVDGGPYQPMTTFVGIPPGTFNTLPGGVTHEIIWDTLGEPGLGVRNAGARVRVTPTDVFGSKGAPAVSSLQTIANDSPPLAQILSAGTATGTAPVDGRVVIRFALFDTEADSDPAGASGRPEVRVAVAGDAGQQPFITATALVLRDGGRDIGFPQGARLRARPVPLVEETGPEDERNVHTFVWDARADGMAGVGPLNVVVRVTPVTNGGRFDEQPLQLGGSAAVFGAEVRYPVGPAPFGASNAQAVALGDLNGDGLLDLVVARVHGGVSVRLGSGGGAFGSETLLPAGTEPMAVALGDLDGDGRLDLALSCRGSPWYCPAGGGDVRVRLGAGNGSFGSETVLSPGGSYRGLGLGDLNGDGLLDLVAAGTCSNEVGVWLGTGGGALAAASAVPTGGVGRPTSVALGDLDGDGRLDLAVALAGMAVNGYFFVPAEIAVRLGTGGGAFGAETRYPAGPNTLDLVLGDVDRDGRLDLVAQSSSANELLVRLGTGGGTFGPETRIPTGTQPSSLALGDLDGDGRLDLVAAHYEANAVSVRLGKGGAAFGVEARVPAGTGPVAAALGDLDGDGRLDLAVGNEVSGDVSVRLGTGGGGLGIDQRLPAGIDPYRAVLGDIDRDGRLDLAATNRRATGVHVRLGRGGAAFGPETVLVEGGGDDGNAVLAPALGDLDGDGRLDLAVVKESGLGNSGAGDALSVFLGTGGGQFGAPVVYGAGTDPVPFLALGDLSGDGRLDLVHGSGYSGLLVRLGTGGGALGPATSYSGRGDDTALAVGDLDGDGRLDLVAGNYCCVSPNVSIRLGTGGGSFGAETGLPGAEVQGVAIADVDGDGHADLLVASAGGNYVSLWPGVGGGAFGGEVRLSTGTSPRWVAAGDIDGDGRVDIVATNSASSDLGVFRARPGLPAVPREGGRDGRGVRPAGLRFVRQTVALGSAPWHGSVGDLNDDAVADLAIAAGGVQPWISAAAEASRPVPSLAGLVPGVAEVRTVRVAPLDLALVAPPLPASTRFAQASLAQAFLPEPATLSAEGTITLPLFSSLTQAELVGGVLRVFRDEEGLLAPSPTAAEIDKRFGRPFYGRLVEVARRDPGGGTLPAGVTAAAVDATAGTMSFPVTRLGRYQAFLEAPALSSLLFRETFDADGQDSTGIALRPSGWYGSENWQAGAPSATAVASGERPAPASAPNLLAIGLRRAYRPSASDAITSPAISVGPLPSGRRLLFRFREWHHLGASDAAEVRFAGSVVKSYSGAGPSPATLTAAATPEQADLSALVGSGGTFRLEFKLTSDANAGTLGRGWYVDDVEVALEP